MFNRPIKAVLSSLTQARHWKALGNIFAGAENPINFLQRYITGRGKYPTTVTIAHTPAPISIRVYSWHDILTINEIFFRKDYDLPPDSRVVVDFGSNIGISALYFLTRTPCHVYAYEPVPENIEKFAITLEPYATRCTFKGVAVSTANGTVTFGMEETGRYGGINVATSQRIMVEAVCANDELKTILEQHDIIDVLKVDIENLELELLNSLDDAVLKKIRRIFVEFNEDLTFSREYFSVTKKGTVYSLENTLL